MNEDNSVVNNDNEDEEKIENSPSGSEVAAEAASQQSDSSNDDSDSDSGSSGSGDSNSDDSSSSGEDSAKNSDNEDDNSSPDSSPTKTTSSPPILSNGKIDDEDESKLDNLKSEEEDDDEEEDDEDEDVTKSNRRGNRDDFKEILENFPDALRRSSRSRKEPERFQAANAYDSDEANSDTNRKSSKRRKHKDSEDWNSNDNNSDEDDNNDSEVEEEEEDVNSDSSDDNYGKKSPRKTNKKSSGVVKQRRRSSTTTANNNLHQRSRNKTSSSSRNINKKKKKNRNQNRKLSRRKFSSDDKSDGESGESEEEYSDDTEDEDSRQKHTNRRLNTKKVSYKEESDYTDSDDLLQVDAPGGGGGIIGADGEIIDGEQPMIYEEEGEVIDKVLEHRMGKIGATGLQTAPYNVEDNGDPNDPTVPDDQKEMQFLIKWKGWSYLHCTWESKESLANDKARGIKKLENYMKREEEISDWKRRAQPEDIDYYEGQEELIEQLRNQHLNVERIIAHQTPKNSTETCHPEYLCKWEGQQYSDCSWEDGALISKRFPEKVAEYYQRQKSQNIPTKFCKVLKNRPKFVHTKTQPDYIGGKDNLELRDYQLDGLNWLVQSWCKENSVILADEMGLGKTIQTISFLNYLFHQHSLFGPFLLVVPLSTLTSWQREFEIWAPEINVVVYVGDATSRNMIRSYEWCHPGNRRLKFNCLLTTYEILLRDKAFLNPVPWAVLGVDEAHRLKNDESFLYKCLIEFDTNHRLLITGTPLQNSLRELWALLHFIMPNKFNSLEEFEAEHNDAYNKGYTKLHSQIQQYLLRRVKKDVEKSLPAKVEQILRVEMTSIQKQYYKWILTKNYKALQKGQKGSLSSFTNIVMELKKCCNHASLIRPIDDELSGLEALQRLIRGSGKLLLLDKLLCRLKETGHRVLIFSQMVRLLDLLGDYLSMRRFPYQRLDGSIRGEVRKQALEHFNAEGSQDFCFLLSTRAGGLGINLATADTVIIFDSDWNPQNDLQAQARAHRIGQKNQVNIYRLVTKGSVEEDIIERAKKKMVLDHLVIQRMDTSGHTVLSKDSIDSAKSNATPFNKEELSAILKFGAQDLFKETENGDEEPQCDIDEILKRAETREDGPATLGDELLNSFKMASFNFNEEEDVSAVASTVGGGSAAVADWDDIIPEVDRLRIQEEARLKEEVEILMLPRSRTKAKEIIGAAGAVNESGDDEYDPSGKGGKYDSGLSDDSDDDRPKRRGRPKANGKELVKGFTEAEVRRFIKSFKKFSNPMKRLESIAIDAELQEKQLPDLQRLATELQNGCEAILKDAENQQQQLDEAGAGVANKKTGNRGPSFKLGGVTVFAKGILSNQKDLEPLDIMLPVSLEERKKWVLNGKVKSANWDCDVWTVEDDSRLLAGVYEYGIGNWEAIKMDPTYKLMQKILPDGELKPQAKQLQSRVDYLLKVMSRILDSQSNSQNGPLHLTTKSTKSVKLKSPSKKTTSINSNNNNLLDSGQTGELSLSSTSKSRKRKSKESPSLKSNNNNHTKKESKKDRKNKKDKSSSKKSGSSSKKKTTSKDKEKKKKKKKGVGGGENGGDEEGATGAGNGGGADELDPKVFNECKEKMRAVKKALKALNKVDDEDGTTTVTGADSSTNPTNSSGIKRSKSKEKFQQHLRVIGAHIDHCLREYGGGGETSKMKEWRNNLWTFVSQFTEYRAKKLYKIYRHFMKNDPGGGGGGNSAGAPSSGSTGTKTTNYLSSSDHSNHSNTHYSMGSSGSHRNRSSNNNNNHHHHHHHHNHRDKREHHRDSIESSHKRDYPTTQSSSTNFSNKFAKHSHRDYPNSSSLSSVANLNNNNNNGSSSSSSYHHSSSSYTESGTSRWSSSQRDPLPKQHDSYGSSGRSDGYYNKNNNNSYNDDVRSSSKRNDRTYYDRRAGGGGGSGGSISSEERRAFNRESFAARNNVPLNSGTGSSSGGSGGLLASPLLPHPVSSVTPWTSNTTSNSSSYGSGNSGHPYQSPTVPGTIVTSPGLLPSPGSRQGGQPLPSLPPPPPLPPLQPPGGPPHRYNDHDSRPLINR